ncbi:MAG: hypothetical protein WA705_26675 [Candidatus Ozemobacteraceae bacterium]
MSITPKNSIAPLGVGVVLTANAKDLDGDPVYYKWTAESGAQLSNANASSVTCLGVKASSTVTLTCSIHDGRGGEATATARVSFLNISSIAVGEHFSCDLATGTSFNLPTPQGNEKYGMILFPMKLEDRVFTIEVNGGGKNVDPLFDLSIRSQKSSRMKNQFSPTRILFEQKLRERRKKILRSRDFAKSLARGNKRVKNDNKQFFVPSDDESGIATITARLAGIGNFCEIFLDNAIATGSETEVALPSFISEFDSKIFPLMMNRFFNSSDYFQYGDINSDSKITILFSPQIGNLGATGIFHPKDFSNATDSNHEDMFYVNENDSYTPLETYKSETMLTLVHEFQHLVNFVAHKKINNGVDEDAWLNEGLSVEAEVAYSGEKSDFYGEFVIVPEVDSLVAWTDTLSDYGSTGLFVHYLYEQLGTETIKKIVSCDAVGIENININSPKRNFLKLFEDWGISMFRLGLNLPADPLYDFILNPQIDLWKSSKKYADNYEAPMRGNAFRFINLSSPVSQVTPIFLNDKSGDGQFKVVFLRTY